jgi:hypothetical protein
MDGRAANGLSPITPGGRASIRPKTTSVPPAIFGHATSTGVLLGRAADGSYSHLTIRHGPEQHRTSYMEHDGRKTGERQMVLGESCEVWSVRRERDTRPEAVGIQKFSCVTEDGIELWYKFVGRQQVGISAEATRIERRVVRAYEVHPPADMLQLRSWIDPLDPPSALPVSHDYEAVLETAHTNVSGGGKLTRTTRRYRSWTSLESVSADGRRALWIENEASPLVLRFEGLSAGEFKRLIVSKTPSVAGIGRSSSKPLQPSQTEIVLGEICTWFDMAPGKIDASLFQFRTNDDIVLKETRTSWGGRETLAAVHLQRKPLALAEVLPPGALLTRRYWRLPD